MVVPLISVRCIQGTSLATIPYRVLCVNITVAYCTLWRPIRLYVTLKMSCLLKFSISKTF